MTNAAARLRALRKSALDQVEIFGYFRGRRLPSLERTRAPKKTLRVNAPQDGIVVEKMVVEGQMVEAGMRLYRLADLAIVWVQAQIYEQDLRLSSNWGRKR